MANDKLLWVRDGTSFNSDIAAPNSYGVDLLWKARTGRTVSGSGAALLQGPAEVPGPRAVGDPRILFDRPLAPQDVSGALVETIYCSVSVVFAPVPSVVLPQVNVDRWGKLGFGVGVRMENSASAGEFSLTGSRVLEEAETVTKDWMYWQRVYAIENRFVFLPLEPVSAGETTVMTQHKFQVKSKRALHEWDDSCFLYIEPGSGETLDNISCVWSALLRLP